MIVKLCQITLKTKRTPITQTTYYKNIYIWNIWVITFFFLSPTY